MDGVFLWDPKTISKHFSVLRGYWGGTGYILRWFPDILQEPNQRNEKELSEIVDIIHSSSVGIT